jgi:hypothetical protein
MDVTNTSAPVVADVRIAASHEAANIGSIVAAHVATTSTTTSTTTAAIAATTVSMVASTDAYDSSTDKSPYLNMFGMNWKPADSVCADGSSNSSSWKARAELPACRRPVGTRFVHKQLEDALQITREFTRKDFDALDITGPSIRMFV